MINKIESFKMTNFNLNHQNQLTKIKKFQTDNNDSFLNELTRITQGENPSQDNSLKPNSSKKDKNINNYNSIRKNPDQTSLKEAADGVEAIFVNMLFKEMRKSLGKHRLIDGGMPEEIFQDMLYSEYAKILSKNTKLGLAEMLTNEFGESRGKASSQSKNQIG